VAVEMKTKWKPGDLFGVKLPDGQFCLGQALGLMGEFKNVVNCAFFDIRFQEGSDPPSVDSAKFIAVISTTRDLLDAGYWPIIGNAPLSVVKAKWPNQQFAKSGYVGAKTYGSGNVKDFLAAYYGQFPWNAYKDSEYFDKLLISPAKKPPDSALKFKDS
jgi:Immunity protein 26